ncbi:MAG: hypothetical protein IKA02_02345 [Clostridia bacterium]|nr:hypothetical protein [Clostridia bacterium]
MKKITSVIIALLMVAVSVLSFASCEVLKTEEVINNAIENTAKLNDFEANVDIAIDMAMTGMTMNIPMDMAIKVKDANKENPISWSSITMEMLGEKITTESYMDSEYVYILSDGEGYKVPVEDAEDEYDFSGEFDESLKKLPVDLIKDIELVKGEDGSYKITVNVPKEVFEELYDEIIDSMSEASLGEVVEDLELSDCVVSVTVKDDYVTNYDISFVMSLSIQGISATSTVNAKYEIVNPGKSVTITPPQGYENFEDLGW